MCNSDVKVFNGIHIVEDPLSVRRLTFIGSSASYLHNTVFNGLKSYTYPNFLPNILLYRYPSEVPMSPLHL